MTNNMCVRVWTRWIVVQTVIIIIVVIIETKMCCFLEFWQTLQLKKNKRYCFTMIIGRKQMLQKLEHHYD